MGNNRSRITPSRSLEIIDLKTRARYKNEREKSCLTKKLRLIDEQRNQKLAQIAFNRHMIKMELRELQHEDGNRQLFKRLEEHAKKNSSAENSNSDINNSSYVPKLESSSLLLHNFNASYEWEKSIVFPNKKEKSDLTSTKTHFDMLREKYASKLNGNQHPLNSADSFSFVNNATLKDHAEIMKKSIRMSVAKAARDSRVMERRNGQTQFKRKHS